MALHGAVGEFDPTKEDWLTYSQRLKFYFEANDVEDAAKQRAILLSVAGPETFRLLSSLVAPLTVKDKTFTELVDLLSGHYNPKKSAAVHRFKFNSRVRNPNESVSKYVSELKKLAVDCAFGSAEALNQMLCDRLLCGINDARIQRRLLTEENLTYDKAFTICQSIELADQSTQALSSEKPPPADIHRVPAKKPSKLPTECYRCGGAHSSSSCRFKTADCRYCGKKGHIARVCRSRLRVKNRGRGGKQQAGASNPTNALSDDRADDAAQPKGQQKPQSDLEYSCFQLHERKDSPIVVSITVQGKPMAMEVDTGAALSVVSESTYLSTWSKDERPPLKPSQALLRTYSGENLVVCGEITVSVQYKKQEKQLTLQVLKFNGPTLLGRDWLKHIVLDWKQLNTIRQASQKRLDQLLEEHTEVFKDELGSLKDVKVHIHVKPDAKPHFYKPRQVPYSMRSKVEAELQRLQDTGVIEPVPYSDWAAPIVPVLKRDNSVRICGDYRITLNREATPDVYPLPKIEDLFANLSGGESFSKLDLAHAYQQLHLDEESKKYTTINTSRGLFQYNRLPFGVSCAPAVFQKTMETLLQGIPGVCSYLDDILVTGKTETEHLDNLGAVLRKLKSAGMRLKKEKCHFMMSEVEYLGHKLSSKGLQPADDKVKAISQAPSPINISQLKSFLGLVSYYSKFLPNTATTLAPLYKLLHKDTAWTWGREQQQAFELIKKQLISDPVLSHYSPDQKLLLSCDASSYGVGAVLSHLMEDGSEKPIAFASRSLSSAEKKYSQLDKEGLAIVFGATKFRQYLLGRHFTIFSDHKPLMYIFGDTTGIPSMASARVQRWALTLSAYSFSISYRPGAELANADGLSRLPLPDTPEDVPIPADTVLLLECLNSSPVTASQIKSWSSQDPLISKVLSYVLQGWPTVTEDTLLPYSRRKDELSTQDGCLLWGNRVVIPPPGREKIIDILHNTHPGMTRIKALARSYVWWPNMDAELEEKVRHCQECQHHQRLPARAPLHPWEWPERPWARIHADFAGPFMGKQFLLMVDAHSKWLEVHIVPTTSSNAAISKMRTVFAAYGLPEILVTDNGSAFTSTEFSEFTTRNGIRHVTSSPYHPSTNGLVERAVQTFKQAMKKSSSPLDSRIANFLLTYRLTPHPSTGTSPAELLMSRRPRSLLDMVRPDISIRVRRAQEHQKFHHDQHSRSRQFSVKQPVLVKNFGHGPKWLRGHITRCLGPLSYRVFLQDGRSVRRHVDHIQPHHKSSSDSNDQDTGDYLDIPLPTSDPTPSSVPTTPPPTRTPTSTTPAPSSVTHPSTPPRRSKRNCGPPKRYAPYVWGGK